MQKLALPLSSILVSITLILSLIFSPAIKPEELTYGPIQSGDRLWDIATQLRPNPTVSRYQVMLALLKANPQAFRIPCNLNSLKTGVRFQIPSLAAMQILTPEQALIEFNRQNEEWRLARQQKQQIVCQPTTTTYDTSIINESKSEKNLSINPISPNPSVVPSQITPVTSMIHSQPEKQLPEDQFLSSYQWITSVFSHWGEKISSELTSLSPEQVLSWLSVPWLIILLGSGILIAVIRSQWRRHSLSSHRSVSLKEKDREQLSAEPLLSTSEIQKFHDEVKLAPFPATSSQEPPIALAENTVSTPSPQNHEIKEKLDNVRSYLAEEEQFIQRTLREVIQKGTPEQQSEAKQLYEISQKINYLKKDKSYLPGMATVTSMNNSPALRQIEQRFNLQKSLPSDPENFFALIDKIFETFDQELNTQGKLIDAYLNRHKSEPVNLENYQTEPTTFHEDHEEISLRKSRPVLKPTRHL